MDVILSLIQGWLRDVVLWHPSAASLTSLLALIATFTTIVQVIKKIAEYGAALPFVQELPFVGKFLDSIAHGKGPVILNILITLPTLAAAAFSDGALQGAEVWGFLVAILIPLLGNDWAYKLARKYVFPKLPPADPIEDKTMFARVSQEMKEDRAPWEPSVPSIGEAGRLMPTDVRQPV